MNGEFEILGIAKCRKFTRLVDFYQTKTVNSTALTGHYCDSAELPTGGFGNTENMTGQWRGRTLYYSSMRWLLAGIILLGTMAHANANAPPERGTSAQSSDWMGETGVASYYGKAHQGQRTASGSRFDQEALTAAHPWLPFGTRLRVSLESGRSVIVTVTDRLYSKRRVIDLSVAAARTLGMLHQGLATVSLSPA